ncbi:unnamed protein product [Vitrella brassicaformis CCMP3155]|uniref:Uncharacterized protein n=1 Tax=Vitrella brassicaformis (strain CCMP3155) TaxID=1169540 RepID=A0A0G4GGJ0_VITBC|nr:unnamed protein product [Vitrella brassicaformis CCMP3155]|eukprot:CEM28756.1 unnamed protein product [Vitrella brassicaformis CCMP3155]
MFDVIFGYNVGNVLLTVNASLVVIGIVMLILIWRAQTATEQLLYGGYLVLGAGMALSANYVVLEAQRMNNERTAAQEDKEGREKAD